MLPRLRQASAGADHPRLDQSFVQVPVRLPKDRRAPGALPGFLEKSDFPLRVLTCPSSGQHFVAGLLEHPQPFDQSLFVDDQGRRDF